MDDLNSVLLEGKVIHMYPLNKNENDLNFIIVNERTDENNKVIKKEILVINNNKSTCLKEVKENCSVMVIGKLNYGSSRNFWFVEADVVKIKD